MRPIRLLLSLCLLAAAITASGHEINVQALSESLGKKVTWEKQEVYLLPLSKDRLAEVNAGRKLQGRARNSDEEANKLPHVNREYADDCLTILENELRELTGKQPSREQMFFAWGMGLKAFAKLQFDPEKVKDEKLRDKWRLFKAMTAQARNPAPLPQDGRYAVPLRYGQSANRGEGR